MDWLLMLGAPALALAVIILAFVSYNRGHADACELHRKAQAMKDANIEKIRADDWEQTKKLEEECAGLRSRIDFMRTRVARAVSELTEG